MHEYRDCGVWRVWRRVQMTFNRCHINASHVTRLSIDVHLVIAQPCCRVQVITLSRVAQKQRQTTINSISLYYSDYADAATLCEKFLGLCLALSSSSSFTIYYLIRRCRPVDLHSSPRQLHGKHMPLPIFIEMVFETVD